MINLSVFAKSLDDKPVAIFGLGVSGLASVKALVHANIKVIAWDDQESSTNEAAKLGAKCQPLDTETLKQCACLILSPGVPLTHPEPHDVVKAAHEAGIEIIGDVEVLHRTQHGYKTIGITGTNGKSTTTALLTHVLNTCGHPAIMGGNIGVPVLSIDPQSKDTIIVLEMSSYQIDLCPSFRPDIGILLNITPDHLDRHGSFENYAAIKNCMLDGAGHAIRAEDLPLPAENFPHLPGDHNKQNIAAVLAVCDYLGIEQACAITAIKTFPGLPHRQFLVREINGVKYINDSKATNAEAAAKALASYDNIYWIAGGQAKEGGLSGLEDLMPKIKKAFLIGECAEEFGDFLQKQNVSFQIYERLEDAVIAAHKSAHQSPTTNNQQPSTILLSPAAASWDQFKSFEHRGDTFTKIVEGLK